MCDATCERLINEIQKAQIQKKKQHENDIIAFEKGRYNRCKSSCRRRSRRRIL